MQLKDKVALITGGGRGIGRAIAIAYAAEGARVVIAARSRSQLDEVAAEITAQNGEVLTVRTDMRIRAEVVASALFLASQPPDSGMTGQILSIMRRNSP